MKAQGSGREKETDEDVEKEGVKRKEAPNGDLCGEFRRKRGQRRKEGSGNVGGRTFCFFWVKRGVDDARKN